MNEKLLHLNLFDFHGLNLFLRSTKIPLEEASFLKNCWTAEHSGSIETRPGMALSGLDGNPDWGAILRGYLRYYKDASTKQRITYYHDSVAGIDKMEFLADGGSWSSTGMPVLVGSKKWPQFAVLNMADQNTVFMVNGADLMWQWDGTTGTSIVIDGDSDLKPKIVAHSNGHILVVANKYPNRVYYNPVAGTIGSTDADWDYFTAYQDNSTEVVGIIDFERTPVVFTDNAMYAVDGFPDFISISPISEHGLFSARTVLRSGKAVYFAGRGPDGFGIFRWSGGLPIDISARKVSTRFSKVDLPNAYKSWMVMYKGNLMLFYPHSSDGTSQCSRCLVWNNQNGYWYEWQDMHFASGFWENASKDIGNLILGSNKGVGGGSDEFYLYKLTEGVFANPFDAEGIEMIWDTGDINFGDSSQPKLCPYAQPHFDFLNSGGTNVGGYLLPYFDGLVGSISQLTGNTDDQIVPFLDGYNSTAFDGTGNDNIVVSGVNTGTTQREFVIEIDHASSPVTFRWSKDAGASWDATDVVVTGTAQLLTEGISVTLSANPNDYDLGDNWIFTTRNRNKACHFLRTRIYYKGTKGVRYNSLRLAWERVGVTNLAG